LFATTGFTGKVYYLKLFLGDSPGELDQYRHGHTGYKGDARALAGAALLQNTCIIPSIRLLISFGDGVINVCWE
jgi:hypothetical protein